MYEKKTKLEIFYDLKTNKKENNNLIYIFLKVGIKRYVISKIFYTKKVIKLHSGFKWEDKS